MFRLKHKFIQTKLQPNRETSGEFQDQKAVLCNRTEAGKKKELSTGTTPFFKLVEKTF